MLARFTALALALLATSAYAGTSATIGDLQAHYPMFFNKIFNKTSYDFKAMHVSITVFALTDEQVTALGSAVDNPDTADSLARLHVFAGVQTVESLSEQAFVYPILRAPLVVEEFAHPIPDSNETDYTYGITDIDESWLANVTETAYDGIYEIHEPLELPVENTYDVLKNDADDRYSTFIGLVDLIASVKQLLQNSTLTTVFAPTNAAFAELDSGDLPYITDEARADDLEKLLMHHIVADRKYVLDFTPPESFDTFAGDEVHVSRNTADGFVDGLVVSGDDFNLYASNGNIVSVKEFILVPKDVAILDVVEVMQRDNGQYDDFLTQIARANLLEALRTAETVTIFAPADGALAAEKNYLGHLDDNRYYDELVAWIQTHYVNGSALSAAEVISESPITTQSGAFITATQGMEHVVVTDPAGNADSFVSETHLARNGVVHGLHDFLRIRESLIDLIEEHTPEIAEFFNETVGARKDTTFASSLLSLFEVAQSEGGPWTVFAPSDDAYNAFLIQAGQYSAKQLAVIANAHIVNKSVAEDQLAAASPLTSRAGSKLTLSEEGGVTTINNATATVKADSYVGWNGVLYVIDTVLVPVDEVAAAAEPESDSDPDGDGDGSTTDKSAASALSSASLACAALCAAVLVQ